MIEKMRIFICQLATSVFFIILTVWTVSNVMFGTNLNNRLSIIGFNYKSFESVAVGLLLAYLCALSMMFVISLMRRPKTNYAKKKKKRKVAKEIDMGGIKDPKRLQQ